MSIDRLTPVYADHFNRKHQAYMQVAEQGNYVAYGEHISRIEDLEAHNEALRAELERQVTGLLTLIELELIPEAYYESAETEVANCRAAIAKA